MSWLVITQLFPLSSQRNSNLDNSYKSLPSPSYPNSLLWLLENSNNALKKAFLT